MTLPPRRAGLPAGSGGGTPSPLRRARTGGAALFAACVLAGSAAAAQDRQTRIPVPPIPPTPGSINAEALLLGNIANAVSNALISATELQRRKEVELFVNQQNPGCAVSINTNAIDGSRNRIEQNIYAPVTVICK